ncbi:MAG: hypothetical protein AAF371_03680 [Pseudomonadota bacterium]
MPDAGKACCLPRRVGSSPVRWPQGLVGGGRWRAGLVGLTLLAACEGPVDVSLRPDPWRPVTDPGLFYDLVAGRRLSAGEDHLVFYNDGRLGGFYDGQVLEGRWRWDGDRLCRTARIGARRLYPDCQLIDWDGERLRVTREEGRGSRVVYAIE